MPTALSRLFFVLVMLNPFLWRRERRFISRDWLPGKFIPAKKLGNKLGSRQVQHEMSWFVDVGTAGLRRLWLSWGSWTIIGYAQKTET
jgi:hypothetical protein